MDEDKPDAWRFRVQNVSGEWSEWFAEADPDKVDQLRSYDYIEIEPLYARLEPKKMTKMTKAQRAEFNRAEALNAFGGECARFDNLLKCPGVGRDKDCISALQFYFSRPVTDDEMRFLHEVVQRAVACMPRTTQ